MIRIMQKGLNTIFFSNNFEIARVIGKEGCTDQFERKGEGVFQWVRTSAPVEQMIMELRTAYQPIYTIIPGVNYNGNGWGTFCEYTQDRYEKIPWTYGWHRASVPSMTCSEGAIDGNNVSVSLFGIENDNNACSIFTENGEGVHRIVWPEQETPKKLNLYYLDNPFYGTMKPQETFTAWLVFDETAKPKSGYRLALDTAWENNDKERKISLKTEQIWEYGVSFAKTLFTREAEGFCGFNIGLYWCNGNWGKRMTNKYEIGWCGQNAMLANALLYEAVHSGDLEAEKMGFAVLDSWIQYARLPIGVIHSYYDPGQIRYLEACNLGTAGIAYFEAYDLSVKLGEEREIYIKTALDICDFAVQIQGVEGQLAKCWNTDGTVAISEGTVGAFLVLPLIEGFKRTKELKYKEAAEKAMLYYLRELWDYGFTTAGALDIFSIDKESCIPLLKGSIAMYEVTGEKKWLDAAIDSAWYLSTWQYTHTMKFSKDKILGQTGYDSHGGTLVSTVHQGIDPFALCYVPELYRICKITGEKRWYSRAKAAWRNGCQHISDGNLIIGGKVRPKGSQDESYTVTRQGKQGIASQWLVAWPTSFRMETIRRFEDEPDKDNFFET